MKWIKISTVFIFFALLFLPLVSHFAYGRPADDLPKLKTESGALNTSFAEQAETYFEENLPIKEQVISGINFVKSSLFKSETANVITGKNGYLFYNETTDDYLNIQTMDNREIYSTAKTIALLEEYCRAKDVNFVFAIAPNKNSILPQNMPGNFLPMQQDGNSDRLVKALQQQNVQYADLFSVLQNTENTYLMQDSHWNNYGAYLAFHEITNVLSHPPDEEVLPPPSLDQFHAEKNWQGDLAAMLNQTNCPYDTQVYFNDQDKLADKIRFRIKGAKTRDSGELMQQIMSPAENFSEIATTSRFESANGQAFILRDSFCRSMLPYFAASYKKAVFQKSAAYDAYSRPIEGYSDFIFEIVERNLPSITENQQLIPAPARENFQMQKDYTSDGTNRSTVTYCKDYDAYCEISGEIDADLLEENSSIYVALTNTETGEVSTYEAFPGKKVNQSAETQYKFYLTLDSALSGSYRIAVFADQNLVAVANAQL